MPPKRTATPAIITPPHSKVSSPTKDGDTIVAGGSSGLFRYEWVLALAVAMLASWLGWASFYEGSTLIGGDLYTYFLPQKAFFQHELAAGRLPFWNNWTGHGYPSLAESQTGVLYPPRLLAIRFFEPDLAYVVEQLAHYIAAFFCMWLYLRQLGLSIPATIFGGVVYVYGWFPTRIILEWAIIGGVYLPLGLWLIERFLKHRTWKYPIALAAMLGVQLLSGHYNLAFLELLTWAVYIPIRIGVLASDMTSHSTGEALPRNQAWLPGIALSLAIFCGLGLGAVQLLPTWHLKEQSQRAEVGGEFQPGYGHIPPLFLGQLFAPSWWNPANHDVDAELARMWTPTRAATNRVEAHLYAGLAVWMAFVGVVWLAYRGEPINRWIPAMLIGAAVATLFATGLPLAVTSKLPGFAYFTGPGRFGMLATFGLAVAGAMAWDILLAYIPPRIRQAVWCVLILFTWFDLQVVGTQATYGVILEKSPYQFVQASEVRRLLLAEKQQPVRLYAPGPNLPNLLEVATTPVYLGIGPAAYYSPEAKFPDKASISAQIEFLSKQGVTHWLSMNPLQFNEKENIELLWSGFDELLNRAWGRFDEPLYLYRIKSPYGRYYFEEEALRETRPIEVIRHTPQRVELKVGAGPSGTLVCTELADADWQLTMNGEPTQWEPAGLSRRVFVPAGEAVLIWSYRPAMIWWGAGVSLGFVLLLAGIGHVRYWHPQWTRWWV